MTAPPSDASPTVPTKHVAVAESPEKAIRNLTHAFEALCTDAVQAEKTNPVLISPTGVQDLHPSQPSLSSEEEGAEGASAIERPILTLHADLQRDLSIHLIQRVSYYSVIHDINKEAASMYAQDPFVQQQQQAENSGAEQSSPLLTAVIGETETTTASTEATSPTTDNSTTTIAIIDEEQWLLHVIDSRSATETCHNSSQQCPPTFLQAMGEQEYANPVNAVTGHARTQLWKPSRSWWEAKSGKNPWIEPASHNKRWRYLWPLIHYHKFLAKCIKKLKRNGVDVKLSVSPVAVFLREEVCAVSDHLAAVSLFGSEEWMACLQHFSGWIVLEEEAAYRQFVAGLKLRPVLEPGDVNSPLLRSQIDETLLRTMVAQREQMRETEGSQQKPGPEASPKAIKERPAGQPPMYPRSAANVPKQISNNRQRRYFGWWNGTSWEQSPPPGIYADNCSVQSALSTDSYTRPHYDYNVMYHHAHPGAYNPYYPMPLPAPSDHSNSTGLDSYNATATLNSSAAQQPDWHMYHQGFYPRPDGFYPPPHYYGNAPMDQTNSSNTTTDPQSPSSSTTNTAEQQSCTPQGPPTNPYAASPYWAHLDQATMAMMATPNDSPETPRRKNDGGAGYDAQGPLVRHQYYGFAPVGGFRFHLLRFQISPLTDTFLFSSFAVHSPSPPP